MRKKVLKVIGSVMIAQLFLYACCGNDFNIFIQSFEFSAQDEADEDPTVVTNEDFFLEFTPTYQRDMASLLPSNVGLINTAYAAIDCFDEFTVIKYVETIEITSNIALFDVPVGALLNDHVLVNYRYGNDVFTINDMILRLNASQADAEYSLRFDTEIPVETTATFTFIITFENDEQLIMTTEAITIE